MRIAIRFCGALLLVAVSVNGGATETARIPCAMSTLARLICTRPTLSMLILGARGRPPQMPIGQLRETR